MQRFSRQDTPLHITTGLVRFCTKSTDLNDARYTCIPAALIRFAVPFTFVFS